MAGIGEYIKALRQAKNYSQRKLRMVSDVSNSTISRVENNISIPDPETLKKLAGPLGVPYEKLLMAAGYLENEGAAVERNGMIKESTSGDSEYGSDNLPQKSTEGEGLCLFHIKNEGLRQWISNPSSIDYLVFAKKLSDLGVDPDFVLKEFVNKIFKKRKK